MFAIRAACFLAPDIKRFEIEAPRVARKQRAGQFVIVRVHERGERIPLTIAGSDPGAGTITLIVQGIGKTTKLMNTLEAGDAIPDLVGPLGRPTEVERYGTVVVIGGGVGTAIAYPSALALKAAGNRVIAIIGGRTRELVLLEPELRAGGVEVVVVTDDGSYGQKGLVTDALRDRIATGEQIDRVLAIGPVRMMQAVAELTRPLKIPTVVSLNALMVDGTGMCGGCRVQTVDGPRFACVDGPEFDAHTVDYEILARRNRMYAEAEAAALRSFLAAEAAAEEPPGPCQLEARHPEVGPRIRGGTS
ncbi:MAG: ferredoxin-NADP+ reductase subunit alpha [Isosphaeraceae bacterium]|jgi:ferredoxin--NADP+ reductase|nr:MAG: ferredoxin-NADP+ reductase subunit alpha [Isosphaeraceae bacterium]